jgi:hypothetical protein
VLKFVLVVALFAGLVYAVMWAIERRRAAGSGGDAGGTPSPRRNPLRPPSRPQTRQVAPDDDEDFLRWLDRKRKNGQND